MKLYADLVLEGGGVKGIALVGAIEVLEERGYQFKRVAGTSAGAIVGALVAAGVPARKMVNILGSIHYPDFRDGSYSTRHTPGKAINLLARNGVYRGDYLRAWLQDQLDDYGVTTFADMPYTDVERPPVAEKAYRLVVTASDISRGSLRYLPWDYDDFGRNRASQHVVEAVRASMSIPFFYRPVRWDTADGKKVWLVDGGMLSNFPITVFDAPTGITPRWPTLGIKLSAHPDALQGTCNPITGPVSMSRAMVKTMTGFYDQKHIESPDAQARTIFIDTGTIRATDFDITEENQEFLYHRGRQAAENFLNGTSTKTAWSFSKYIATYRDRACCEY